MNRSVWQRPRFGRRRNGNRVKRRDGDAINRLRRMAREPPDDVALHSPLHQDIPNRFDFAGSAGDGPNSAHVGIRLKKIQDAMFVWRFPGGDRVPKQRGKNWPKRGQIAHHTPIDNAFERGHLPGIEKWIDQFPIGGIPTDQKDFFRESLRGNVTRPAVLVYASARLARRLRLAQEVPDLQSPAQGFRRWFHLRSHAYQQRSRRRRSRSLQSMPRWSH